MKIQNKRSVQNTILCLGFAALSALILLNCQSAQKQISESEKNQSFLAYEKAMEFYNKRNYENALAEFNKAIELNPNNGSFFAMRGNTHERLDQGKDALEDYTKALELDPTQTDYYLVRAMANLDQLHFAKSIADADTYLNKSSKPDPTAFEVRGFANLGLQKYEEAYNDANLCLQNGNKDASVYILKSKAEDALARYKQEVESLNTLIRMEPRAPGSYVQRAMAQARLDDWEAFSKDIDSALQLDPKNPTAIYLRGFGKFRNGDQEGARKDYEKSKSLGMKEPWYGDQ